MHLRFNFFFFFFFLANIICLYNLSDVRLFALTLIVLWSILPLLSLFVNGPEHLSMVIPWCFSFCWAFCSSAWPLEVPHSSRILFSYWFFFRLHLLAVSMCFSCNLLPRYYTGGYHTVFLVIFKHYHKLAWNKNHTVASLCMPFSNIRLSLTQPIRIFRVIKNMKISRLYIYTLMLRLIFVYNISSHNLLCWFMIICS